MRIRFLLGAVVAIFIAMGAGAGSLGSRTAEASHEQWLILSRLSTGCESGQSGFNISFVNLHDATTYWLDTVAGFRNHIYMDEFFSATAPGGPFDNDWFIFNTNDRGMRTFVGAMPPTEPVRATMTLRNANQVAIWHTTVEFFCNRPGLSVLSSGPGASPVSVTPGFSPPAGNAELGGAAAAIVGAISQQARENRERAAAAGQPGNIGTPPVAPPRTGGGIQPPSTGDAGLSREAHGSGTRYAMLSMAVALAAVGVMASLRRVRQY